jgi:DNA-binding response OmpR family regulator
MAQKILVVDDEPDIVSVGTTAAVTGFWIVADDDSTKPDNTEELLGKIGAQLA